MRKVFCINRLISQRGVFLMAFDETVADFSWYLRRKTSPYSGFDFDVA